MLLYVLATRTRKGKEDSYTIKFDLAKYSAIQIASVLSNFDSFEILSYKKAN